MEDGTTYLDESVDQLYITKEYIETEKMYQIEEIRQTSYKQHSILKAISRGLPKTEGRRHHDFCVEILGVLKK